MASWFLEQLEPGSGASEFQPALQPALYLPRNDIVWELGHPSQTPRAPGAMVPIWLALRAPSAPRTSARPPPKVCRFFLGAYRSDSQASLFYPGPLLIQFAAQDCLLGHKVERECIPSALHCAETGAPSLASCVTQGPRSIQLTGALVFGPCPQVAGGKRKWQEGNFLRRKDTEN